MDSGNRIISTLAVTVVLTTLAIKLQSDPVRPVSNGGSLALSSPTVPTDIGAAAPVYPRSNGPQSVGASNPPALFGAARWDTENDSTANDADTQPSEDEAADQVYDAAPVPEDNGWVDEGYSPIEPGVISDQEILSQVDATLDPEQRVEFSAYWATLTPDERQDFLANMRGY